MERVGDSADNRKLQVPELYVQSSLCTPKYWLESEPGLKNEPWLIHFGFSAEESNLNRFDKYMETRMKNAVIRRLINIKNKLNVYHLGAYIYMYEI